MLHKTSCFLLRSHLGIHNPLLHVNFQCSGHCCVNIDSVVVKRKHGLGNGLVLDPTLQPLGDRGVMRGDSQANKYSLSSCVWPTFRRWGVTWGSGPGGQCYVRATVTSEWCRWWSNTFCLGADMRWWGVEAVALLRWKTLWETQEAQAVGKAFWFPKSPFLTWQVALCKCFI